NNHFLENYDCIDYIIYGEGEEAVVALINTITNKEDVKNLFNIALRENHKIITTPYKSVNLQNISSPYKYINDLSEFDNKIIYYESSRGCPYNCGYCLSSATKGVHFFKDENVIFDLKRFIDNNVKQVKFIDRTFNCNKNHAIKIWEYLIANDNNVTNFHFEISADLLEETISVLKKARKGLFQLEIGVQSSNENVLKQINRKSDLKRLKEVVLQLNSFKNIHLHLDLIAGLPYEDLNSFKQSYNFVYQLEPDQLQLGFLKLLKGSYLRENAQQLELVYSLYSPYEILHTKWLTYEQLYLLKRVEELTEKIYNSGLFKNTLKYLQSKFSSPFELFENLSDYFNKNTLFEQNFSKNSMMEYIINFAIEMKDKNYNILYLKNLLCHDSLIKENIRTLPEFLQSYYDDDIKKRITKYFEKNENKALKKFGKIQKFDYDVLNSKEEQKDETFVLYKYEQKDYNGHYTFEKIII
ncbi:MAG: DUF4080 domain-containing protein, partial [Oscillospiraceae bacterium]